MEKYRFNNRDSNGLVNLREKYCYIRSDRHEIATYGLHHPGTYRRRDESAIERAILESISRLWFDLWIQLRGELYYFVENFAGE